VATAGALVSNLFHVAALHRLPSGTTVAGMRRSLVDGTINGKGHLSGHYKGSGGSVTVTGTDCSGSKTFFAKLSK
jgi:hypothetical protein